MAELLREAINSQTLEGLAERITQVYPQFESQEFLSSLRQPTFNDLGLFERLDEVTQALIQFLPQDFTQAAPILMNSLGSELDALGDDPTAKDYGSHQGFIVVALGNYIAQRNQPENPEHFELSMQALLEMTKRFSSEGPIREFIIHQTHDTLKTFEKWTQHKNVHVRRLVSESLRPRLPWTQKIQRFIDSPEEVFPFLEQLKDDAHLYVRRSVANNLNDITKDHPDRVCELLQNWVEPKNPQRTWLIKHSLRTLIKKGHPKALELIGISPHVQIEPPTLILGRTQIQLGESLPFELKIKSLSTQPQELLIDFIIHHQKANGTLSPKVFKWTQKTLLAQGELSLKKSHSIKKISTRKYYEGEHKIEIQINGRSFAQSIFHLSI